MEQFEVKEEKRFAVVMYGGVSLAIYMNGVAQELFKLVQSTSGEGGNLTGSAAVYRKLAEKLKAKFLIDILAGTSAGGINAVFLAKALANGQSFDPLEAVWVSSADIGELINDRKSITKAMPPRLKGNTREPGSLLNGNRLYTELLNALNGMEGTSGGAIVDDLDLFVTATDLQGNPIAIQLADEVVRERQYRGVFHFQKTSHPVADHDPNEMTAPYNPFIAFATRCTSSFPLAFEPVRLQSFTSINPRWRHIYECPVSGSEETEPSEFDKRSFADGGYLDNKPFSYAIDSILTRAPAYPLDRKLIYIEPSPEDIPIHEDLEDPPTALRNVVDAFTLSRYETIQQDLFRVRRRNRLIERTNRILRGAEDDIARLTPAAQPPKLADWKIMDFHHMLEEHGFAYGGYFRLRVARLTDDLTDLLARHAGISNESDDYESIRAMVRAWRDARYTYYDDPTMKRDRYTDFIVEHDFGFHLRRLSFVIAHIDTFLLANAELPQILSLRGLSAEILGTGEFRTRLMEMRTRIVAIRQAIQHLQEELFFTAPPGVEEIVRAMKHMVESAGSIAAHLRAESVRPELIKAAERIVKDQGEAFEKFFRCVQDRVDKAYELIKECKTLLSIRRDGIEEDEQWPEKAPEGTRQKTDWLISFYFRFFSLYDTIAYPLLQCPELGEEIDEIEVIRIRPKNPDVLGGSRIGHFGAFFDKTWRKHDILRGRLDGAEGIIRALCGSGEAGGTPDEWVKEAKVAIATEWLARECEGSDLVTQIMTGSCDQVGREEPSRGPAQHTRAIDPQAFLDCLDRFRLKPSPRADFMATSLSRMIRVLGRVLRTVAKEEGSNGGEKISGGLAAIGSILVGLLEVLLPGTWREIFFRRFLYLLMLFGLVMIIGGAFLTFPGVGELGWVLFGGGLLIEAIRSTLLLFLKTGQGRWLLVVPLLAAAAVFAIGILYAPLAIEDLRKWFVGLTKL